MQRLLVKDRRNNEKMALPECSRSTKRTVVDIMKNGHLKGINGNHERGTRTTKIELPTVPRGKENQFLPRFYFVKNLKKGE